MIIANRMSHRLLSHDAQAQQYLLVIPVNSDQLASTSRTQSRLSAPTGDPATKSPIDYPIGFGGSHRQFSQV